MVMAQANAKRVWRMKSKVLAAFRKPRRLLPLDAGL
jgi:hypothetical protein